MNYNRHVDVIENFDTLSRMFGLFDLDTPVKTAPKKKSIKDHIDRIIYNGPATIVFWDDGTKTVAKCDPRDENNKAIGVLVCVTKYLCQKAGVKYSDMTKLHP